MAADTLEVLIEYQSFSLLLCIPPPCLSPILFFLIRSLPAVWFWGHTLLWVLLVQWGSWLPAKPHNLDFFHRRLLASFWMPLPFAVPITMNDIEVLHVPSTLPPLDPGWKDGPSRHTARLGPGASWFYAWQWALTYEFVPRVAESFNLLSTPPHMNTCQEMPRVRTTYITFLVLKGERAPLQRNGEWGIWTNRMRYLIWNL